MKGGLLQGGGGEKRGDVERVSKREKEVKFKGKRTK